MISESIVFVERFSALTDHAFPMAKINSKAIQPRSNYLIVDQDRVDVIPITTCQFVHTAPQDMLFVCATRSRETTASPLKFRSLQTLRDLGTPGQSKGSEASSSPALASAQPAQSQDQHHRRNCFSRMAFFRILERPFLPHI